MGQGAERKRERECRKAGGVSDLPATSEAAFHLARASSRRDAVKFRRLGAWLASHEAEAMFDKVSAEQERSAQARMAQFETGAAEAW